MFKIDDDLSIHLNRGNICSIGISALDQNDNDYIFQVDDVVRLNVYSKKNMKNCVLQKDVIVTESDLTEIIMNLTSEDTMIGDIINKPIDYWYQINLNPETNPQTIIGYDEDGAKIFRLYPEGVDIDDPS